MKLFHKLLLVLLVFTAIIATPLLRSSDQQNFVQAQEVCEVGPTTINVEVLCWTADAVSFVMNNQLFSILDQEDLRDAVKHYRFYQLVMSELN